MDTALWMRRLLIILVCLWMTVMVLMPLFQLLLRSMVNPQGEFVGLANYAHYFKTPSLSRSLVKVWPYKLTLGFWHYRFTGTGGGGYAAFFNSIRMSLYSADIPLAAVAIANMDDAGDVAPACAMSILVVITNLMVRIFYGWLTKGNKTRSQAVKWN